MNTLHRETVFHKDRCAIEIEKRNGVVEALVQGKQSEFSAASEVSSQQSRKQRF